ncbi:hypothetical protein BBJ28_00016063, partial [Nothophytophthora sp. Chile5]
ELVAESCHLGVSHPPGYPLFNMAVYLTTTYLPFGGNPAWRANFFSAGESLKSLRPLRHRFARNILLTGWCALFGFSPLIWTYAVGAEVFALNNAFTALLIYQLLQYTRHHSFKWALLGAFTCGLAMCNQHTIVLFELPIIVWVLWTRRRTLWWQELAQVAGAFLLGLTPYVYMPITGLWNPQAGSWGDVTTLTGLLHHIRRADYGTFRLYASHDANEDLWTRLYLYGVDLSTREIPLQLAFPVVALGIWQSLRLNRQLGGFILGMYGFYMVVFHALANLPISEGLIYGVQMRFWQQPNVIVFLWLGLGLNYAVALVQRCVNIEWVALKAVLSGLCQGGCLLLVGVQIWRWHGLCDQSQAFYIRNYAQALLDPLPRDAVLFVNFDLQWTSLRYLQRCEFRRPDVTVLNLSMMTYHWFATKHEHYPHLQFPGTRLVPFGSARPRRFFLGGRLSYNDQDFSAKYTLVPYGLLDEFQRQEGTAPSLKTWYSSQQKVKKVVRERLPLLPPAEMYSEETWEWTIARDHAMKALSWATYLLEKTIAEDPHNLLLLSEATRPMEASYQFEPPQFWNAASNLKNLGLAYAQIVKSSQEFDGVNDPFFNREVGQNVQDSTRFKDRASARMLEVWDAWLQVPEAKQDPGYQAIEGVVRQFVPKRDDQQFEQPQSGKAARQRQKRTKKRKAKTQTTSERLPQ